MEKKINIANILKHCPKGMKLDCTIWGWNIEFDHINIKDEDYPIVCHDKLPDGKYNIRTFTKYGYYSISDSKCVIFPKGKTTWEGFVPPCEFKEGDIIYTKHKLGTEFVSIFRVEYERDICTYWDMNLSTNKLIGCLHDGNAFKVFIEKDKVKEQRFATEEEKERLFDAIKENGYRWNTETKTLDKLPKFKVGDKIKRKGDTRLTTIKDIRDNCYIITIPDYFDNAYITDTLLFSNQNEYELVPNKFDITTLKPFDKVLVRDNINEKWNIHFFSYIDDTKMFKTIMGTYIQCIPYEGNVHLLGTADDCADYFKTWE